MGKCYVARLGGWSCGGLTLRPGRVFEIGVGDLPRGFKSWEEVQDLLERHPDKDDRYFEVPNVAETPAAPVTEAPPAPKTVYACPYCRQSFEGMDKLRGHMDKCPDLTATGHFENAEAKRVEPLSVPDEAAEKAAGEKEAKIRQAQAEAEAKAEAEKKEKNAKTYGKKSGGLDAKAKAARKAAKNKE